MKKTKMILGIDTSNYTTSLAVSSENGRITENIKIPLPVKEGEIGLRQSDAVFAHTKNIPEAFRMVEGLMHDSEVLCIGVSDRPRDAQGSYMPCFLSGVAVATALSEVLGCPLYTNSHQSGHIMAAMYSSGMLRSYHDGQFISFHVSGGTTEMLLCEKSEDGISARIIGETLDLNAGQAVDRCGVMLGCRFPCGREIEALALEYYKQHGKIGGFGVSVHGTDCNLSGVENLTKKMYENEHDSSHAAAFVLEYIAKTLVKMTDAATKLYGELPLLYAGGVMSNSIIKERIRDKYSRAFFAEPQFSSDNAAGTALLARECYLKARD